MPKVAEMKPSRFLKQSDFPEPQLVTVSYVDKQIVDPVTGDEKWCLNFAECTKPMVLNGINMDTMQRICDSDDTDDWAGKKVVVFNKSDVEYQGRTTGGLRIRAPNRMAAVRPSKAAEEVKESEWAGAGMPDDQAAV